MIDDSFVKLFKTTSHYFHVSSWSCLIILNRTRDLFPSLAPDCLCPASLTRWSITLLLNKASPNSLPFVNSCSLVPFTLYNNATRSSFKL